MFCGGSKKKPAQSKPQAEENLCKIHSNPLDYLSVTYPNKTLSFKACQVCKQSRVNEEFISVKELKDQLIKQDSFNIVEEFKHKLTPLFNQTEDQRKKLINLADEIYQCILNGIHELFAVSIIKQFPNNLYSPTDIFDLIQSKTIDDFMSIIDQQVQFLKADEVSASLLTKVLFKTKESQQLLDCIKQEDNNIKKKLEKVQNELSEIKNSVEKIVTLSKKSQVVEAPKIDKSEPVLNFMIPDNKQDHETNIQLINQINSNLPIKPNAQEQEQDHQEVPQVKSIVDIDNKLIGYSTGERILIFDKTDNFKYVQQLDCENSVSAICVVSLNNKPHLCACVEENEQQFQLQFWDWQTFEKIKVINAHSSYIWQIINLPKGMVATCSEDTTIKVFNCQNSKLISTIAVHQASVNDIALLNAEILISVSDDGLVAASSFLDGDQKGMAMQDGEIKCVIVLDGCRFVTGNTKGDINIYLYHDQTIELLKAIEKIHKADVRFLSRIDQILFVSSSFDGTHKFFNVMGELIKSIEGPKKNFSEPLMWVKSQQCLVASSKGILHRYK